MLLERRAPVNLRAHETYLDFPLRKIDIWISKLEVNVGWNFAILQYQHSFDQTCDSGSPLQVPNVWFQRTNDYRRTLVSYGRQRLGYSFEFSPVSGLCTGSVAFDISGLIKIESGVCIHRPNVCHLSLFTWKSDAFLWDPSVLL